MSRWFRLYDCVLDDPKVQRLAPPLFKTWINLLCVASRSNGALPNAVDLSFMLRLSESSVRSQLKALASAGLLDERSDGTLSPHNWEDRQFKSDVSTERVKRFRERSKQRSETVSETPPDTETETDTEEAAPAASSAGAGEAFDAREAERRCIEASGWQSTDGFSAILDLVAEGHDLEDRILPMVRTIAADLRRDGKPPPRSWAFVMKAVRDPTRRVALPDKAVEMIWIPVGSSEWRALSQQKRESYLRSMITTDSQGAEGIWWSAAAMPSTALPRGAAA